MNNQSAISSFNRRECLAAGVALAGGLATSKFSLGEPHQN